MQGGAGRLHQGPTDQLRRSPFPSASPYLSTPEVPAADCTTVRQAVQVDGAASLSRNPGYGDGFGMAGKIPKHWQEPLGD